MKDLKEYITEQRMDMNFVIKSGTIGKDLRRISLVDMDDRPNSVSNLIQNGVNNLKIKSLIAKVPSMKDEIMDLVKKSTYAQGGISGRFYDELFRLAVAGCKRLEDIPSALNTFVDRRLERKVMEYEDDTYAIWTSGHQYLFLIHVK